MNAQYVRLQAAALILLVSLVSGCTKAARQKRFVSQGDRDFAAGKYERAEIAYKNAMQVGAPNGLVIQRIGEVYYFQGRWGGAMGWIRAGLEFRRKSGEDDPVADLRLAQTYFFRGNYGEAFTNAVRLLKAQPTNEAALSLLVDSARDQRLLEELPSQLSSLPDVVKNGPAYKAAHGKFLIITRKLSEAEAEIKDALQLDPNSAHAHFGLASLSAQRGQIDAAVANVKKAFELLPERSGYRMGCLQFLLILGKKNALAKQLATEMNNATPDFIPSYLFLAQLAASDGKLDEGLALAKKALSRDPENPSISMVTGDLYLRKEDGTNALVEFQHAEREYKDYSFPELHYKLGLAQLLTGNTAKAIDSLNLALNAQTKVVYADALIALCRVYSREGDPRQTLVPLIPWLERLVKEQTNVLSGHIHLIDAYAAVNSHERALMVATNAVPLFPTNSELPYRAGMLYQSLDDPQSARRWFEKSLAVDPGNLRSLAELVNLDQKEGRPKEARELIDSAIKDQPDSAPLQYVLGEFELFMAGKLADSSGPQPPEGAPLPDTPEVNSHLATSAAALQKAIELDAKYEPAYFTLARLYLMHRQQKEALQTLEAFQSRTNSLRVLLLTAEIHQRENNYAKAAEAYETCLRLNRNPGVLNNLAYLYAERLNNLNRAQELAQQARGLAPKSPGIADTLGWILYRRGDFTRASALVQEAAAAEGMGQKPEIQYHLGAVQYAMGDEQAAQQSLEKALKIEPSADWRDDAKRKLANLQLDGTGKDASADAAIDKGLVADPTDPVLLCLRGTRLSARGDYQGALKALESALRASPENRNALLNLARLQAGPLNNPAKAMELVQKARTVAPSDPEVALLMGRLAYKGGNHKLAVSSLEECVRARPNEPQVQYELALALYSVGRGQEALERMNKVSSSAASASEKELARTFVTLATSVEKRTFDAGVLTVANETLAKEKDCLPALMLVGLDKQRNKDYRGAAASYDQLLKVYPLFPPAVRQLGLLYATEIDEPTKASDLLTRAREAYPTDSEVIRALGMLALRRGDYNRAVQLLSDLSREAPNDPELLFYIGKGQANLNLNADARRNLQEALKSKLSPALEAEARQLLSKLK